MKKTLTLLLIVIIGCSNQTRTSEHTLSLKSNNLKGAIRYFSDKKTPAFFINNDWEILVDTTHLSSTSFENKYFDENGYLTNLKYFDSDSNLLVNSEILYANHEKYSGYKDFDHDGNLIKDTKVIDSSPVFLVLETYDTKTGNLLSKSKTEYENGFPTHRYTEYTNQNHKSDYSFKRNNEGNEIEISYLVEFGEQKLENISYIKYLKFDSIGNWIKRIDYNREKGNECMLTIRKITYYE